MQAGPLGSVQALIIIFFIYIPLNACTSQSGLLFAITHASKGNC